MEGQMIFEIFNSIIYLTGSIFIVVILITMIRQIKEINNTKDRAQNSLQCIQSGITANHQYILEKLNTMHAELKDIQSNIKVVESKIGDLTMRVNIAEVRLEERKPQQFMIPQIPSVPHAAISVQPRRPGRPKSNPK